MTAATSPAARIALRCFFVAFIAFLYAPIAVLIAFSFNDDTIPALPLSGFTGRWYSALLENQALLESLATSARVAVVASTLSVVLALLAAQVLVKTRFRGRQALTAFLLLPLVLPLIVLGVALFVLFRQLDLELGFWSIVVGHVVLAFPYVLLVLLPRLHGLDLRIEEAARDLGAGSIRVFLRVTGPLLAPALVSSWLVAFVISFDEFAVASFTAGNEATFPLYLVSQLRFPDRLPQVMAVAVVAIAVSTVIFVLAEAGRRRAEARWE